MKIEIKSWLTGTILFEGDFSCIAEALKAAVKSSANLSYANLSSADLSSANLSSADLSSADLSYANLSYANLSSANLSSANLRSADLSYANLSYANLSKIFNALPKLSNPDAKILELIENGQGKLDMGNWHQCETTHCRAGWYIHQSGEAGKMLEAVWGPSVAGALIFAKAYPNQKVPNFHAADVDALNDIRANAAKTP